MISKGSQTSLRFASNAHVMLNTLNRGFGLKAALKLFNTNLLAFDRILSGNNDFRSKPPPVNATMVAADSELDLSAGMISSQADEERCGIVRIPRDWMKFDPVPREMRHARRPATLTGEAVLTFTCAVMSSIFNHASISVTWPFRENPKLKLCTCSFVKGSDNRKFK